MIHGTVAGRVHKVYTQNIPTIRSKQFWEALGVREQLLGHLSCGGMHVSKNVLYVWMCVCVDG